MTKKAFKRVVRPATAEEKKRHGEIRAQVTAEFPPSPGARKRERRHAKPQYGTRHRIGP